jgi:arabinogalactan oligomer/maltooligosaccharide transport system permease protein
MCSPLDTVSALVQVLFWLVATFLVIGAVEGILYVNLYRFQRSWFWPFAVAVAAGAGVLAAWLWATPHPDDDMLKVWSWSAGAIAAGVMLVLPSVYAFRIRGKFAVAQMMLAPAFLVVCLLVVYPFFFEFRLAFANLNLYSIARWLRGEDLGWVGFDNFVNVFTSSPLQTATFWDLFLRTIIWTAVNLVFHVGFGLGLAMLLNKNIKAKGIYRTLLILPWAIPQVVAVLAWRGEFHPQFGFINHFFNMVGLHPVNWWSDPVPVFVSCCIVNIWLGIPFMMIVFLGGLQSIPKSYYEAASIDGASKLTQFTQITLPMLKPVVVPSITLGTIWTFNNINVIYLMTGQDGGNEYADILVSALYKSAFTYSRYSFSAAFALVIFTILIGITLVWMRLSKGTEGAV